MPQISKDLKTGVCRTEFEMEEREYYAIGRVTVQWAYLEHGIFAMTLAITREAKAELPKDALSTSFNRRLGAFRKAVEQFETEPERARLLRLISQTANAQADRHKITHGLWEWDRANPERLNASSFRPSFEFEKPYDFEKVNALADRIGVISCAFEYPKGWESLFEDYTDANGIISYGSISRLGALYRHHRNGRANSTPRR